MIHMFRRFSLTFVCFLLLAAMSVLLVADNLGVSYSVAAQRITSLPDSVIAEKERYEETSKTCLVLRDSTQENSDVYTEHVQEVLEQMRVGYHLVDVSQAEVPAFSSYRTVVLVLQRLDVLGDTAVALCEWVKSGGGAMLFCTPESTPVYRYLSSYLGVEEGALSYAMISGMELSGDFMIGSEGFQFHWGEPMTTALDIRLKDTAKVYAYSDDENRVPLVWENDYGEGRFVVMNHGMSEKTVRGLTCAAYSLLEDTCVYLVINASSFFLDDFPSPVPMGDGQYIRRDYNRDISSFYSNVWWPDMLQFCDDYGVRYTGMIIEDYSDEVDGLFPRQSDQERFNHFGALLLDYGGEIGLHGYNHQPLCFTGFDFQDKVDYNTWKTKQDAVNALTEVLNFTQTLFPDNQVSVYVPPSNILSEEGRELLHTEFPQIKTISSLYIEGEIIYRNLKSRRTASWNSPVSFPAPCWISTITGRPSMPSTCIMSIPTLSTPTMCWMRTAALPLAGKPSMKIWATIWIGCIPRRRTCATSPPAKPPARQNATTSCRWNARPRRRGSICGSPASGMRPI